ncbi:hypothetical protein M422DRAFT_780814 [Sphaerobolus stellatus SS14]|uniref:Mediator of RNA polymerase II transcription subunit 5 n=1 Tax=Sphaerobolus stellatus (strain SS14) TaxID=990650 RepID=A0A0C9UAG9_SPHS4|nr:hypothetical protein M422DRAFT_780814 [Sphaerobolus stellatus SS14]
MTSNLSQVEQVTRASYFSGLSAEEWTAAISEVCSDIVVAEDLEHVASTICDTILSLLASFYRDPTLKDYLRTAVLTNPLPVQLWHVVRAFLKHVRTIHDPSTMDMICRLILDLHYGIHLGPLGSLVPYTESANDLLANISDAIYLLRISYDIPASPFHNLIGSSSNLLSLLLACIGDLTSASTAQLTLTLSSVHELLQIVTLEDNVRNDLDTLLLTLSLLLGDSTRQAEDAEMFANFQMTPSRQDTTGPNPSFDILSGSLIMNRLVSKRATQSGAGCEDIAVANLLAWYRVSSQTLPVFFAHVILSAIACLAQESEAGRGFIWKSFVLGRIPIIMGNFQERLILEAAAVESEQVDANAIQSAIAQVFTHTDLLNQCEPNVRSTNALPNGESMEEETKGTSFRFELLGALISSNLMDHPSALELYTGLPTEFPSKLSMEAQESGTDVDMFIESKFSPDATLEDTIAFLERITNDHRSHAMLASVLCPYFIRTSLAADVESLGRICKALTDHEQALDIMSLHAPLHDMVAHALACLEDYDLTTVGDPQTAVSHIGEVVLFLQSVLARFKITSSVFHINDRLLRSDVLHSSSAVYAPESLSDPDKATLDAWRKAIFDRNSEGIDDDILRSTKPKTLLCLSATLFSDAVASCIAHRIDADALQNGVSYYMGPLLNWTLVGVVQALLDEVERASFQSPQHVQVLETILADKSCPSVVLRITRQHLIRVYSDPKAQGQDSTPNMVSLANSVLKPLPPTSTSKDQGTWLAQPRSMLRYALACANAGRVPNLDVDRCLAMISVRTFLDYTWRELLESASIGKIEICRRFATYLLAPTAPTTPNSSPGSRSPPLLPIFLHAYVPNLLLSIDRLVPAEQTLSIQLLCTVIVSALTFSVNFERALLKPPVPDGLARMNVLPSAAMAKRLRLDLRKARGQSALALFQKLSASSTFVSTFPSL